MSPEGSHERLGAAVSAWSWIWRIGGVLALLLVLVVAGLLFYASTPHFANIVRQRVITVLEDATGGRVEIQSLHWSLEHLAVEVDGLTIHGLEGRGELPYAHIDRLYARAKILSFLNARLGPRLARGRPPGDPSHHLPRWPHQPAHAEGQAKHQWGGDPDDLRSSGPPGCSS